MKEASATTEQKKLIENFLRGYSLNGKLLTMEKYRDEYFGDNYSPISDEGMPREVPLARARMFEVRHFILSLKNSDEKLFLYYHYIKGDSVERCSELLGISERSCYRLKNKALLLAYNAKFSQINC